MQTRIELITALLNFAAAITALALVMPALTIRQLIAVCGVAGVSIALLLLSLLIRL